MPIAGGESFCTMVEQRVVITSSLSKEMWRTLIQFWEIRKKIWRLKCKMGNIISEHKAVVSKFIKFVTTIGWHIAKKLRSLSRDSWKKHKSVIQTDDENERQCVNPKLFSKILHESQQGSWAGQNNGKVIERC